jgi:hypothetical protein
MSGSMPALSDESFLSWILGGKDDREWGVSGYMPRPPSPQQAEDDPSNVSSSSASDKEAAARWLVLCVNCTSSRRRILTPLNLPTTHYQRDGQGSRAPATSRGQLGIASIASFHRKAA